MTIEEAQANIGEIVRLLEDFRPGTANQIPKGTTARIIGMAGSYGAVHLELLSFRRSGNRKNANLIPSRFELL